MMQFIVLVILALTNQLSLGSPLLFPDEVNVDNDAVWTLNTMESKLEVNGSYLVLTNTSALLEQVMLPGDNSYVGVNNTREIGEGYLGNEQRNETDLLSLVEDKDPNILNNGSIKISSDNSPRRKSMEIKVDPALDAPSEDGTEITLYRNVKRRDTDKQILFPNTRNPVDSSPIEGSETIPIIPMIGPCRDGYIRYQGECSQLLSSKPCGENENWWLVMKGPDFAECEPRPCPLGQIFYQDICIYPEVSNICAEGQILYVELTGESFCDCESNYFYNVHDGTCVSEYTQGWCNWGEYIVRNGDEIPVCVPNPCGLDEYTYFEQHNFCYRKSYIGFCEQKHIKINGNEAECIEVLDMRNIFEVPRLRCPRGSLRDILHECRRSVLKYKNHNSRCPTGFTKGPRGRCIKIANLFAVRGQRG